MKIFTVIGVVIVGLAVMAGCRTGTETGDLSADPSRPSNESVRGTAIGRTAPEFELAKADGGTISLKDLEGKASVIVFWTAWCPICKEEAPRINKLAAEFEPKGVNVVGINIGESDARITEGIKDFGIKYTVAKDTDTSVAKSYKVIGTPTIVFLDRQGVVRYNGNELPNDYAERLNKIIGS